MQERSRERASGDPFAITPDPKFYVPRAATETARKQLLRSACNPAKTSALIGPPGLGKTLLLHLLAQEVPEGVQTVYLPYAALPPEELCAWALGLLGLPAAVDPMGSLQEYSRNLRERGSALLILIDDAGAMPVATARWAGGLVQRSGGSVRLAIAASDNATGNRTIAAIGSNFDIVHLDDPMTESETSHYIDGRFALARVPDSIRARFDAPTVRLLHRISAGIPRRLHSAATAILQEAPSETAEGHAGESATSVAVSIAPVGSAQPLGAPADERRVARRRAEPEGIAVRVGPGGPPTQKGRRSADRVEPAPEPSEPAADRSAESKRMDVDESAESKRIADDESAEFEGAGVDESAEFARMVSDESVGWEGAAAREPARSAPIEGDAFDDSWVPDRELSIAPPGVRRARPASRRSIALGTLLVAFAAVAIPVIRSILSEPHPSPGIDQGEGPGEPARVEPRPPQREGLGESKPEDPSEPSAQFEPAGALAREDLAQAPAAARTAVAQTLEAAPVAPPSAQTLEMAPVARPGVQSLGSFAVQINATPWANVEVDGIDLGATPLANIPLLGGAHFFRVRMPDGRVIERSIEIDAERRFISFE